MCGINGFNWRDEALITKMNGAIRHRGPDATDVFFDESISLGHDRLSIIDLSTSANQPMKSDDGRYVIVFNGEIYNFQDLKDELSDSYPFKTHGDTEVILAAYIKWGKDCVKRFNGIFAFAIWDSQDKELFLARDHNGIKPLYYHFVPGPKPLFLFSSEIKGILEYGMPRKLRKESLSHYLRILYVPEPYTMFEGIMKLPSASYATYKDGKLIIEKYWELSFEGELKSSKAVMEAALRKEAAEAVKRQLISDRPLGIFLSGGLDSTVVLHHVSEIRKNIDTYSVGFDLTAEEQSEKFNADFDLAKKIAEKYGTNHHEILLSTKDVVSTLEKAVWHLDEPIANPTIIPQYIISQFAKKTVAVVLGGDGGDELFGGYDRYRFSLYSTLYQKLPKFIRSILNVNKKLAKLDVPAGVDRFARFLFQKDKIIKEVAPSLLSDSTRTFFNDAYFSQGQYPTFEQQFMDVDRRSWLIDEALMRTDKMTMSAGLEARVPFLDKKMIEFAAKVPLHEKIGMKQGKLIVRNAYKGLIPDFVLNQPKRGWFSPGAKWLRNETIGAMVKDVLSAGYHPATSSLFDWDAIGNVFEEHKTGKRYNATMLWAIIIFQVWAKRYDIRL